MSLAGLAASAFATLVNRVATQAAAETAAASTGMPAAMPMAEAPGQAYYLDGSGQYRISVAGNQTMARLWPKVRVAARLSDWYPQGGGGDPNKQPGGSEYLSPDDWNMLNGRWGVIRSAANWSDLGWHLIQPQAMAPPAPPPPPPLVQAEQVVPTTIKLTPTEVPPTPVVRVAPDVSGPVSTGIDWSYLFRNDAPVAAPPQTVQYAQGDSFAPAPAQASTVGPAAGGLDFKTIGLYAAMGVGVLYMLKDMRGSATGRRRGRGSARRRR